MKLSKRDRYILKWNGPLSLKHKKRVYRSCKAGMGKGTSIHRECCTAYVLRFRGGWKNETDFFRAAGTSFRKIALRRDGGESNQQ